MFQLSERDIAELELLQRSTLRRILNLPANLPMAAVYGLLGIRPIRQEIDIRKLILLGSTMVQKHARVRNCPKTIFSEVY